ncbi:MAG: molecular chaperone [bacterium]|nr:molecular chaperone [bacterium]
MDNGVMITEDVRTQQVEALQTVNEYIGKLIPSMETVAGELSGDKQEDTDAYLQQIIDGLNWVIEVFNGTMSLINEERVIMDKDEINREVVQLSEALIDKNDARVATVLESGILPFLKQFQTISAMYQ